MTRKIRIIWTSLGGRHNDLTIPIHAARKVARACAMDGLHFMLLPISAE